MAGVSRLVFGASSVPNHRSTGSFLSLRYRKGGRPQAVELLDERGGHGVEEVSVEVGLSRLVALPLAPPTLLPFPVSTPPASRVSHEQLLQRRTWSSVAALEPVAGDLGRGAAGAGLGGFFFINFPPLKKR